MADAFLKIDLGDLNVMADAINKLNGNLEWLKSTIQEIQSIAAYTERTYTLTVQTLDRHETVVRNLENELRHADSLIQRYKKLMDKKMAVAKN